MKIGKTGLKMSSGKMMNFKSPGTRERFEKFARMYKAGGKAKGKGKAQVMALKRGK